MSAQHVVCMASWKKGAEEWEAEGGCRPLPRLCNSNSSQDGYGKTKFYFCLLVGPENKQNAHDDGLELV